MYTVILVVHILAAIFLIGVILIQRSEADGLLSGSGSNLFGGRTAANFITRTTAVLATIFILTSLGLNIVGHKKTPVSISDQISASGAVPRPSEEVPSPPPAEDIVKKTMPKSSQKPERSQKKVVPAVPKPE